MVYKRFIAILVTVILVTVETSCGQSLNQPRCGRTELVTAKSCIDYLKNGSTENGYYRIYDAQTNKLSTVYCDLTSEPGSAWTLVQSFALKNVDLDEFGKSAFPTNAPVNDKSPNWNLYRMSLEQMKFMKSQSTHWRVTCSFPNNTDLYTDYARSSFAHFDIVTYARKTYGNCKKMEYVNIRGEHCVDCTVAWFTENKHSHPHIKSNYRYQVDSYKYQYGYGSAPLCNFEPYLGSVTSENNFGYYANTNSKFRCSSSPRATTNWWFGSYI